ncbi:hypothetical protein RHS01_02202 [Rhizoctonia solani]|uniref:Retrotransposon gag domain-containing protein n=1 Tax=Rhizoctonia solani TaxID=456999 RepID=A0A8H7ILV1_9AGAM|nr:hypothetical protein RHS01_02202 [Rhizoctonia solani]
MAADWLKGLSNARLHLAIQPPLSPLCPPLLPTPPLALPPAPLSAPLPTKAACTLMRWQPAPGAPLVPHPLSIKESWDLLFRQPLLSQQALNPSPPAERELEETKEVAKEAQDWMGAVNQALTCIEARGGAPHTPEDRKPPAVKATPRPIPKTDPLPAPSAPLVAWANPTRAPPTFAQPTPVQAPPRGYTPPLSLPIRLCSPQVSQPTAPVATYQPPVKVDHPDAYTRKIGNKACQWLTQMLAWVRLNQWMFPTDQEVLSFLLMNMKDVAGAWAHPHLDQLGSHRALIQTVDEFKTEFLAAFGNLDAMQAAERQITHLTQTGTCAEYITKFRTIAMDLDWNNAALRGQFAHGLHWRAEGLCIKCSKTGHKFVECRTGWKATPKEESIKKEATKIGKESGPKLGKD